MRGKQVWVTIFASCELFRIAGQCAKTCSTLIKAVLVGHRSFHRYPGYFALHSYSVQISAYVKQTSQVHRNIPYHANALWFFR